MSREALKQHLSRLQQELASGDALDPETRALLARVSRDIERVLHEGDVDKAPIVDRVEAAALEFEATHPRLAGILSEVTDTLAKLGV